MVEFCKAGTDLDNFLLCDWFGGVNLLYIND